MMIVVAVLMVKECHQSLRLTQSLNDGCSLPLRARQRSLETQVGFVRPGAGVLPAPLLFRNHIRNQTGFFPRQT